MSAKQNSDVETDKVWIALLRGAGVDVSESVHGIMPMMASARFGLALSHVDSHHTIGPSELINHSLKLPFGLEGKHILHLGPPLTLRSAVCVHRPTADCRLPVGACLPVCEYRI